MGILISVVMLNLKPSDRTCDDPYRKSMCFTSFKLW